MRWLVISILLVFVLASGCVSPVTDRTENKIEFNVTSAEARNEIILESSTQKNVFNPAEGYRFWIVNVTVKNLLENNTNLTDMYLDTQEGRYNKNMMVNFTTYPRLSEYCAPLMIPLTLSSFETRKGCVIYQVLKKDTNFDNGTVGVSLVTA